MLVWNFKPCLLEGKLKTYLIRFKDETEFKIHRNFIHIIKQDIQIYVPYSHPNCWTEWADIFCGHCGSLGDEFFFQSIFFSKLLFFFHGQRHALQLVIHKELRNYASMYLCNYVTMQLCNYECNFVNMYLYNCATMYLYYFVTMQLYVSMYITMQLTMYLYNYAILQLCSYATIYLCNYKTMQL